MGMPVSVLARGLAARSAQAADAVAAALADLRGVDALFSTYRPQSEVSRLNRGEIALGDCLSEVREVAVRCARARELTGGLFDADRPDGTWDPSGLVKGWAAERATRHLAGIGGLDWCLNVGGDVAVVSATGRPFGIGIQDPRDASLVAVSIACRQGGVATSGTAARGTHIYDPRTGAAAGGPWFSVTVLGASLETADVLATAAFVAGPRWADVIRTVPGYDGVAVAVDGTLTWTAISDSVGAASPVRACSDHDR